MGPLYIGLLIASLILLGGSLFYILYGFASGFVSRFANFPPPAQQIILYKFSLALRLFEVGFCLLLGALFLRYLVSIELGLLLLLAGLFLYLAIPLVLGFFYFSSGIYNLPLERMIDSAHLLGGISIVVAGLLLLIGFSLFLHNQLTLRELVRGKEATTHPPRHRAFSLSRILKPCWDTPYCRDFLREFCPAYNKKRSCWKAGGGCLCDEAIVNRLLAQTRVESPRTIATLKRTSSLLQRKLDCSKCPIYAEHQRQKYQVIAPLIPISIVAIFWFAREAIHHYYLSVVRFFDNLFSNLAYLPTASGKLLGTLATPWLETTIILILALFLIGILLHLLEYLVFSLDW